jgi:hypothetical protein
MARHWLILAQEDGVDPPTCRESHQRAGKCAALHLRECGITWLKRGRKSLIQIKVGAWPVYRAATSAPSSPFGNSTGYGLPT